MDTMVNGQNIEVFSTCPPMADVGVDGYLQHVVKVARWSERSGCKGILVYSDNSKLDPWLIAQIIIQNTGALCPLIAVQPIYMHPYTVAKAIVSIAQLYSRRVYLNMVAGGFKNDLTALNDDTPHDKRYDRLVEYTDIIMKLLRSDAPVSHAGEFYRINNLKLSPPCPEELLPGVFISGSSEAGMAAARAVGATAIQYPKPPNDYSTDCHDDRIESGVRIGIISRGKSDHAWAAAHERFPEDHRGQITRQLANRISDSEWHKQLAELARVKESNPYWLVPFENYKTNCPYLVGDYQEVGRELARYIEHGYHTFITDVPEAPNELNHIGQAFGRALEISGWQQRSSMTG